MNGYVCLCPADYTGQHCDVKSSTCSSGKCASGSTCVNTPEGNDCECPDGYEGTFCEQQSNVRTRKKTLISTMSFTRIGESIWNSIPHSVKTLNLSNFRKKN